MSTNADDLVQETLVAAWGKPAAAEEASLRPWLASVMRNRFRMLRRGRARRDERERVGEAASASTIEPEREVERLEVLRILLAELEQLPAEDRMIIVRRFFDGESAADIGRALDMPAATVRSRLHRSLRRLRCELDRRFTDRRTWCAALGLGPMVGTGQTANSTKGGEMSITAKGIIVASVVAGVGGAGWVATRGPEREASVAERASAKEVESASPQQRLWEERRMKIRRTVPETARVAAEIAPPFDADAAEERRHQAFRALVSACLEDLESGANGALTIDVVEIGAPDVGVIYESVDVVTETLADPEVLQCIVESMYAFVGDAPETGYERTTRRTLAIGHSQHVDAKAQRMFDAVIGAHINEVRFCQTKAGTPVDGPLEIAMTIAKDGSVETVRASESDLPPAVVDCVVKAAKRWLFPEPLAGRTLEYSYVLPVREFPKAR